jgi:hypothetical protein
LSSEHKLSFVLPVTLREQVRGQWRRSPDENTLRRTRLVLASFVKNFRQQDLLEFSLVCPAVDVLELTKVLESVTRDPRYRVVDEFTLCPHVIKAAETHGRGGWMIQQLIKLEIAQSISSAHYVTLDSDVLCVKPFSHASLIVDGRSLTNLEYRTDYERLYSEQHRQHELTTKRERLDAAATILGYRRPDVLQHFYGETPVVLHTQSVIELTQFLSQRLQQPWTDGLLRRQKWTEYSLYFQFLEMTGRLKTVLDLEKSVWLPSEGYRQRRQYDVAHFTRNLERPGGFFVVIQSWLLASNWLPARCRTVQQFYDEVEAWLL